MSQQLQNSQGRSVESSGNSVKKYLDKPVYTSEGVYVGEVEEVMISLDDSSITGLGLTQCNSELFKNHSHNVGSIQVPYEWVLERNDVVVLRSIPEEGLRL